jgi:hypothetical protein
MTKTCGVSISGLWGVFLLAGSGGWAGTLAHYAGVMAIYLRMDSTERRIYFLCTLCAMAEETATILYDYS